MNILYLHGLNSSLSGEKRTILEKYGTVLSPSIDYESDDKCIENLRSRFAEGNVDVVTGSSMGGFVGFYLSIAFNKPALLFNPALIARSVFQNVPDYNNPDHSFKRLVLGATDEVVDPKTMLLVWVGFQLQQAWVGQTLLLITIIPGSLMRVV